MFAKGGLLLEKIGMHGPKLPVALDWVGAKMNRAAVSTLITGDWFLGVHAGNFFAK